MTDSHEYPTDLEAHITLDDRRRIRIRALHVREADPIHTLHARLSPQTRYLRFLSPMPSLPDSFLPLLMSTDYRRHLAVIAEDETAGRDEPVAMASFGAVDDETAEVAVVVQDDWQGHGVGRALVDVLLDAAEDRGFHRFVASMTSENTVMRKLLNRIGRVVASKTASGVCDLAFVRRSE
jgi:RimJ/RimL family protein N-acetyltransferase